MTWSFFGKRNSSKKAKQPRQAYRPLIELLEKRDLLATLSIPTTFSGAVGDSFLVPVNLDVSDGLEAADIAIQYDTTRLNAVVDADVQNGSLTSDFSLIRNTATPPGTPAGLGTIRAGMIRSQQISGRGAGSVLNVRFTIRAGAPAGDAIINLMRNVDTTFTNVDTIAGGLSPAPTNNVEAIDGRITVSGTVTPTLQVTGFSPTPTGFIATFNRNLFQAASTGDHSGLSLYERAGLVGPADVTVTRTSDGRVFNGSLVVSSPANTITFVHGGSIFDTAHDATSNPRGILPAGTYNVVFRSAANAFRDQSGALLDGNRDNVPGDNFTTTMIVGSTLPNNVVVGIRDFARGNGQTVTVPNTSTTPGLPVNISNGVGVAGVDFNIQFNPSLLNITGFTLASGLSGTATFTTVSPGNVRVTVTSTSQLTSTVGNLELGRLTASVPSGANYTAKHLLDITNLRVARDSAFAEEVPVQDDDAVHVVAFLGDATGDGGNSGLDATRVAQVVVNLNSGYEAYQLADPVIVGDITGDGGLSGLDATRISQNVVGSRPEIPPIPAPPPLPTGGPDPQIRIPRNLVGVRGTPLQDIPITIQVPAPEPGVLIESFDIAIRLPGGNTFAVSDVRLNAVLLGAGFSLAQVFNPNTGEFTISSFTSGSGFMLAQGASIDFITFDLTPQATAPDGPFLIDVVPVIGSTRTGINEGLAPIVPPPIPGDDPNDGRGTIGVPPMDTFALSAATYTGTEAAPSTAVVTITRTANNVAASVTIMSTNGSATAPADFTAVNQVVNFTAGQTSATVTIAIVDDTLVEGDENFTVTLSNPTAGAMLGTPSTATVTITDNDVNMPGTFTLDMASYTVGEGAGTLAVVIQRSANNVPASVTIMTSPGTATAPADYGAVSQVVNFTAGQTSATVNITIVDDALVEGSENFTVALSSPTAGAMLGTPSSAPITITDNDNAGTFQFSAATFSGTEASPSTAVVTVTRTANNVPASVTIMSTNGTAVAPGDYTAVNQVLNFTAGQTSATVTIAIVDDALVEGNEDFSVALSSPTGGAALGSPSTATVTIVDNDVNIPGTFTLDMASYTVGEGGGSLAVIIQRTANNVPASVTIMTTNGTAVAPGDYTAVNQVVNFTAGQMSATVNITIVDDALVEGSENFTVALSSPTGGAALGTPSSAPVTITDNDNAGTFQFSAAAFSGTEAAPSTAVVTVTRTANNVPASVTIMSTNGTAVAPGDYTAVNQVLNFTAGQTSATVTIAIVDDALVEGNEDFSVALSAPTGGAALGSPSTATVTIVDNDVVIPGTFTLNMASYTVGEGAGTLAVVIQRSANNVAASVTIATTNGTAVAPGDYTAVNQVVNFTAGQTSATVNITIVDDALVEGSENFTVALSNPTAGAALGTPSSAPVTITDNDNAGTFQFSAATFSGTEASPSTAVVTVTRTANNVPASVTIMSTNGTAVAPGDFAAVNQVLNFTAGQTSATVTIAIVDDALVEGNEDFSVALSAPTGGAALGTPSTATVTIVDNDVNVPGTFTLDMASYSVNEGAGTLAVTIQRSANNVAASVTISTTNGTAVAPGDFTAVNQVVNFTAGQTSAVVNITIVDDALVEGNENFTVALSSPTAGAALGTPSSSPVTIVDNDVNIPGTFTLNMASYSVNEGAGTLAVVIQRSANNVAASVTIATTNGTAVAPGDYTAVNQVVNFTAGQTSATINIAIVDDVLVEGNENFTVALSNPTAGAALGTPSSAPVTIVDNDVNIPGTFTLNMASYTVGEGAGTLAVVIQRSANNVAASVTIATTNGTAVAPGDYTAVNQVVNFTAGQTSATVNITIVDDALVEGSENFTVALSNPTAGAALGTPSSAPVTITDNDNAGTFQFSAATFTGSETSMTAVVTITRTANNVPASVTIMSANGTAVAPGDYTAVNQVVNFTAGQTSATVSIVVVDDALVEGDENFTVALSNPTAGAGLGSPSTATVTITDNDVAAPLIRVESVAINQDPDAAYRTQRSLVTNVVVTFSGLVNHASIAAGDFTLVNLTTGGPAVQLAVANIQDVGGRTMVTLTFTGAGIINSSLSDGRYQLTVMGDGLTDTMGRGVDADGNGMLDPGPDNFVYGDNQVAEPFFRLFGDHNGNAFVDNDDQDPNSDLNAFISTYGLSQGDSGYLRYFDFDGNGIVDGDDYFEYFIRIGTSV